MAIKYKWRARTDRGKEVGFWPFLVVTAAAVALALVAGSFLRLNANWEDALFVTVTLFVVLILALRPAWHRWQLWRDLGLALCVHLLLVSLAVEVLTANSRTMGGPLRTLTAMAWCMLLLGILWRRNVFAVRPSSVPRTRDDSA